jgi:aryl-alcohol dehydrogenase-like predicted oxidoreductase
MSAWPMPLRPLGRTGVHVSPLCLGTMMFGAMGNADVDDCVRIIHRAVDAGINLIDTADIYSHGAAEEILGKAIAGGLRDDLIIATKFSLPMSEYRNRAGSSRRWIFRSVDASLRRLGTDWIDIYQAHRPDPTADIEETIDALDHLVRAGKILYAGHSTFAPHEIVEAQWAAQRRHATGFVTEQPRYSLLSRAIEKDVLPLCAKYQLGVLPWSPLAGGWLSGRDLSGSVELRSPRGRTMPARYDPRAPENAATVTAVKAFQELATELDLSLIHLALAFVISHPTVTSAIIGPRTMEHLESQLGAVAVNLGSDVMARIDEIVPPETDMMPLPPTTRAKTVQLPPPD